MTWCFSGLPFCSCIIGFLSCFSFNRSICSLSLNPLFLIVGEFQACDWLWCPLTCGPRCRVGVHMGQKSRFKFLSWKGFDPRTFHLAVQHVAARPPF